METTKSFPAELRERRKAADLTQGELAKKADTSANQISRLEKSEQLPRLDLAVRLAAALGCSVADFVKPPRKR